MSSLNEAELEILLSTLILLPDDPDDPGTRREKITDAAYLSALLIAELAKEKKP